MNTKFTLFLLLLILSFGKSNASNAEVNTYSGFNVTEEGAWCWFADPRALHYENEAKTINSTYIGYIDIHGNIKAMQYDFLKGEKHEVLIRSYFQPDDHNNPTFLVLPDERIMIFYSRHTDEACFYYRISQQPGDITTLGDEVRLATANNTTYPSPFILSDDPDHIYLCWRGINWHPTIAKLNVPGKDDKSDFVWGPYQIVQSTGARPYAKYKSNGKDKILLTYTTGHPDNESPNWIYFNFINIKDLTLEDVNGNKIANVGPTPFNVNKSSDFKNKYPAMIVEDASLRNWVWQVTSDKDGKPVIAMVRISNDKTSHDYYYAKWTGSTWRKSFLINGGGHFHQTAGLELCYSGGMSLDDDNPEDVYCSVPVTGDNGKVYEILKYTVNENGVASTPEYITRNSAKNNARPYIITGAGNSPMRLAWMYGEYYDWIVSKTRPLGYPTGIRCDYDFPGSYSDINNGIIFSEEFEDESLNPEIITAGTAAFTGIQQLSYEISTGDNFTLTMSPYIHSSRYEGEIFSLGNISYNVDANTLKPSITIDKKTYQSSNRLATADGWKGADRGTGGNWVTPVKLEFFNLTVTYDGKNLKTFINGLADQCIEIESLKLSGLKLGGYAGWMKSVKIYNRVLNSNEITELAEKISSYNIDDTSMTQMELELLNIPSVITTDLVLPTRSSTGNVISWTTSNSSVISRTGLITYPTEETEVTLRAILNSIRKSFTVKVLPRDISNNLLLQYDFEESDLYTENGIRYIKDKSGNNHDAAIYGNAVIDGTLNLNANTSAGFSTNGYAVAPEGLLENLRSYTFFLKVNPTHLNKAPRLYDFGSASSNSVFGRGSALTAGIKLNGATTLMINSSKSLIAGNESYVAFTYDATTKKTTVYLDGENTGSGTTITVEPYQVEAIAKDIRNYIGRTQWWDTSVAGDNNDYCGSIDNFRVYNVALTSDEIKMLQTLITSLPEDVKLEHINISPNPVKKGESFTIALGDFIDKNHKVSIDIISLTGKKIVSQNNVSGKIKFSGLRESGVYIILVRKNQKDYITSKLFVV